MAGSVGLEVAAGRDAEAVPGEAGYYKLDAASWLPCPNIPGEWG